MRDNFFNLETPNFAKAEAHAATTFDVYNELMDIAMEIARCRASV